MNLSIERIAAAAVAIDPVFKGTPQFLCDGLSGALGRPVLLKVETLNPIRSFKGRGTSWFAQSFVEKNRPVICASAGNFGQGVAYCGTRAGLTVRVVAATNDNPLKLEAMKRFGRRSSRMATISMQRSSTRSIWRTRPAAISWRMGASRRSPRAPAPSQSSCCNRQVGRLRSMCRSATVP
jgi:threonine dehydratase